MLTAAQILGHRETRVDRVEVEEFGGEVCIAKLTAAEADRFRQATVGEVNMPLNVLLTILGACDGHGVRLFVDTDATVLATKTSTALTTIANKVLVFNGMAAEAKEEAKNASSETASDASASDSPSPSDGASKS